MYNTIQYTFCTIRPLLMPDSCWSWHIGGLGGVSQYCEMRRLLDAILDEWLFENQRGRAALAVFTGFWWGARHLRPLCQAALCLVRRGRSTAQHAGMGLGRGCPPHLGMECGRTSAGDAEEGKSGAQVVFLATRTSLIASLKRLCVSLPVCPASEQPPMPPPARSVQPQNENKCRQPHSKSHILFPAAPKSQRRGLAC